MFGSTLGLLVFIYYASRFVLFVTALPHVPLTIDLVVDRVEEAAAGQQQRAPGSASIAA